MRIVKRAGSPGWAQRKATMHGTTTERGYWKAHGQLARMNEKPATPRRERRAR